VIEDVAKHHEDAICVERLLEYLVSPQLGRFDGGANCRVSADHHDDRRGIQLTKLLQRFEAVHAAHLHIHEDEVRLPLLILRDAVSGVRDSPNFVTFVFEQLAECSADALLVVDDEDASAHGVFL
jgi:hypothetical protein